MGSPNIPDPLPPPATRPERRVDVELDQIQLGGEDQDPLAAKGKKALLRPKGTTVTASSNTSGVMV